MTWIFLSPHYDDVAFSCGGLVWELCRQGANVQIWTVCSGLPPAGPLTPFAQELHARWGVSEKEVIQARQAEDRQANAQLGAAALYLGIPDCIYRRLPDGSPLVEREEDLWQPVPAGQTRVVDQVVEELRGLGNAAVTLVSPYGLGDHIDHHLTRLAAERFGGENPQIRLLYYADFPYVLDHRADLPAPGEGWEYSLFPISSQGMAVWEAAIRCFRSQLSTFWADLADIRRQVEGILAVQGGYFLLARSKVDQNGESRHS